MFYLSLSTLEQFCLTRSLQHYGAAEMCTQPQLDGEYSAVRGDRSAVQEPRHQQSWISNQAGNISNLKKKIITLFAMLSCTLSLSACLASTQISTNGSKSVQHDYVI